MSHLFGFERSWPGVPERGRCRFHHMRSMAKLALTVLALVVLSGCSSKQSNPASPQITLGILDEHQLPLKGIEVTRRWYDDDPDQCGSDELQTDAAGLCVFPEVARKSGSLLRPVKRLLSLLGPCGAGSGTETTILVRYSGQYEVKPKDKTLHSIGASRQDQDGVWFQALADVYSHSLVYLTLPQTNQVFDYTLLSRRYDHR